MRVVLTLIGALVANLFKPSHRLEVENLFLRHQLSIALRRAPHRVHLRGYDRALLVSAHLVLGEAAGLSRRGSAGDDPAVASRWVSGLLALEIPWSTRPAESQP